MRWSYCMSTHNQTKIKKMLNAKMMCEVSRKRSLQYLDTLFFLNNFTETLNEYNLFIIYYRDSDCPCGPIGSPFHLAPELFKDKPCSFKVSNKY